MIDKGTVISHMNSCLTETNLDIGTPYIGKVRDMYFTTLPTGEEVSVLVSTDRQSAFDRNIGSIPFKGSVLSRASAWWFEKSKHIVKNHMIAHPDSNVIIAKKCRVLPIEFVVRGYMTGSTSTSIWKQYDNGVRNYCGIDLPEGLVKNQKLEENILTPTTKEVEHDRPISPTDIISEGWITQEEWDYASKKSLELFAFGQKESLKKGLILVDTKYEFGVDEEIGEILLIDELHTPDSSRFWLMSSYEDRISKGLDPDNIDKEFFRLWFAENCDPYNDEKIPDAPESLTTELSLRYIQQYEMITGNTFTIDDEQQDINQRIKDNVFNYLKI